MPPRAEQLPVWSRRLMDLADHNPRRAVELALQDARPTPWCSFTQGWAFLFWERLADARARLEAAREAFRSLDTLGLLLCEYGLLLVDQQQLARQGCDKDLAELATLFDKRDEPALAMRARLDQARQLNILGQLYESETVLEGLARSGLLQRPVDLARMLRIRAVTACQQGEYHQAVTLLDKAELRFRRARQQLELARCWFERAAMAVNQERLDETLAYCARAEEIFRHFDLPLHRAFSLKVAGLASIRQGHYEQAFRQTQQALALFQELGRVRDLAACTLNLGNIYYHSGSWAAALGAYSRAEKYFVAAEMIGHKLTVQRNRAMVYRASGRLGEAKALLKEIELQTVQLGFQAETAEIWAVQAALLANEGRVPDAVRRYDEAHSLFLRLGNETAAAECRLELGWLALGAGDSSGAATHFDSAAGALMGRGHHAWRVRYGQACCAELAGRPALALQRYGEASAIVRSLRKQLGSESLSSDLYAQANRLHTDALVLALDQHDAEAALRFAESQRALTIQRFMLRHAPSDSHAPQTSYEAFQLDHVRQTIRSAYDTGWTALVYILVDDRLVIIGLTDDRQLYVMQADGSEAQPITSLPGPNSNPIWLDSTTIVFANQPNVEVRQPYIMRLPGDLRRLSASNERIWFMQRFESAR